MLVLFPIREYVTKFILFSKAKGLKKINTFLRSIALSNKKEKSTLVANRLYITWRSYGFYSPKEKKHETKNLVQTKQTPNSYL